MLASICHPRLTMERSWVILLSASILFTCCTAISLPKDELGDSPKNLGGLPWDLSLLSPGRSPRAQRAAAIGQTDFNAMTVKKIVSKHNEFRAAVSPSASNMQYMTWDAELATMAQRWADRCRFEHGNTGDPSTYPFDPVGQNIFSRGGEANNQPPPSDFVPFWHSEVSNYRYNSNACVGEECGHYTQVVWATSHKVGCGLKYCDSIGGERNAWFVVCNYGTAGNFYGEKPYETGEPCSQCDNSKPFCFRNMCHQCNPETNTECVCPKTCKNCGTLNADRCTCNCANGFTGPNCAETCQDIHEYCGQNPGWPDETSCSFDPLVPAGCPLMCGLCRPRDQNFQCANPNGIGVVPRGDTGPVVTKPKKHKKKNKKNKNKKNKNNKNKNKKKKNKGKKKGGGGKKKGRFPK